MLLPALEAADFAFMGELDTRVIHFQLWLVLAGFLLALVELLAVTVEAALVWPVVLLVAAAPAVHLQTASAIADIPVAAFFALAGVCGWRWLADGDRLSLRLLGVFSAGALATKIEGRIFVLALFLSLLTVLAIADRRRLLPTALVGVLAALAAVVPWLVWTSRNDVSGLVSTSVSAAVERQPLSELVQIPTAAVRLAAEALDPTAWLLLVPFAIAGGLLAWRSAERRPAVVYVALTACLCLAGLVFVYWTTPLGFDEHLEHSARRVVTAPVLFLAALTPLLLASARAAARGTTAG
jgi:4-amino-4-deoxy-L-arabinose transferase-like glycosyltransferase